MEQFIARFNLTSAWIETVILTAVDLDNRVYIINSCIKVAEELLNLRNYLGVMEIVLALTSSNISRLTQTWDQVYQEQRESFKRLQKLMDMQANFKDYRALLASAATPAVPYVGIFLRDLTFIRDSGPDFITLGLMNVAKASKITEQLLSIESFQRGKYPLLLVPRFRELIEQMTSLDEDQLYEISKRIQPVNTDGKLGKRHSQTRVKAKSGSFFGY
eukprot:m.617248 g.617248  ORF g.617248 m.617248 type:complete len:217 (-) comp58176_c0_seq11:69-719(-)